MHTGSNVFVRLVSYANDYGGVAATAVSPWLEWTALHASERLVDYN